MSTMTLFFSEHIVCQCAVQKLELSSDVNTSRTESHRKHFISAKLQRLLRVCSRLTLTQIKPRYLNNDVCSLIPGAFSSLTLLVGRQEWHPTSKKLIRYDTRCYFNVRSKADTSQLNLPLNLSVVQKLSGGVLAWLSVWSEVQTCIWPSGCHRHSLSLASVKSRLVFLSGAGPPG